MARAPSFGPAALSAGVAWGVAAAPRPERLGSRSPDSLAGPKHLSRIFETYRDHTHPGRGSGDRSKIQSSDARATALTWTPSRPPARPWYHDHTPTVFSPTGKARQDPAGGTPATTLTSTPFRPTGDLGITTTPPPGNHAKIRPAAPPPPR